MTKVLIKNIDSVAVAVTRADGSVEILKPLERKNFDSAQGGVIQSILPAEAVETEGDSSDETPAEPKIFGPATLEKPAKKAKK